MASSLPVRNLPEALAARRIPTVTTWNRLEARPRTLSFDRALRAEVRDALWLLCKQWQMGEFKGSDAGSPAFAKLQIDLTRLTKYQPDAGKAELFEYTLPFNPKVESRPLPLMMRGHVMLLDLRISIGRYWLSLIAGLGPYQQPFINAYPISAANPFSKQDADICAHPEAFQLVAAFAGRAMDGGALIDHLLANPSNHAYDGIVEISTTDFDAIDKKAARLLAWFQRVIYQPTSADDAWIPEQLEYQFAASAPLPDGAEKVYVADGYYQSSPDWYTVDVSGDGKPLPAVAGSETTSLPASVIATTIPVPVSFAGMPNTRWWSFEDNKTNFGDIDAATTDLAKLLFIEFALVYANDWFVIPYKLPRGSVATVRGLVVTNVFGERLSIARAESGAEADWQRWSMFTIDVRGQSGVAADTSLLLLPVAPNRLESPPTESALLIRDEVANMVWGVETTIPLPTGEPKRGLEAARQIRAYFEALLADGGVPPLAGVPPAAPIRYQVMTTVPENWIPFVPVRVDGSNREVQLQRAALPRVLEGDPDPPVKIQPRTVLLREGLDRTPARPYFVFEEEVPRAGAKLTQLYERTRWTDGRVYTWLRVRKQTGRGEGSSGLAFDQLVNAP